MKVRRKDTPVYDAEQYFTGDIANFVYCLVYTSAERGISVRDFSLEYDELSQVLSFSFVADVSPEPTKFVLMPYEYVVIDPDNNITIMSDQKFREVFG